MPKSHEYLISSRLDTITKDFCPKNKNHGQKHIMNIMDPNPCRRDHFESSKKRETNTGAV